MEPFTRIKRPAAAEDGYGTEPDVEDEEGERKRTRISTKAQEQLASKNEETGQPFRVSKKSLEEVQKRLSTFFPLSRRSFVSKSVETTGPSASDKAVVGPYAAGIAYAQCDRPQMEDRFCMGEIRLKGDVRGQVFTVIDGHGGQATADVLQKTFIAQLEEALNACDWESFDEKTMDGFWKDFSEKYETFVEAMLEASFPPDRHRVVLRSGAALTCCVILKGVLWALNVGDCRILLGADGKAFQLSQDDNASNEKAKKGVKSRGGEIIDGRLWNSLAVLRAFGDTQYRGRYPLRFDGKTHTGITSRFTVRRIDLKALDLNKLCFLILASDGLWGMVDSEEAVVAAAPCQSPQEAAEKLLKMAMTRGIEDNTTVLVVHLGEELPSSGSQSSQPLRPPSEEPET